MLLQSKEEPYNPQLPAAVHIQDVVQAGLSTVHEQRALSPYIPDENPPPYSNSNNLLVKTIQLEKHLDTISGTYIIDPDVPGDDPSTVQSLITRNSVLGIRKASESLSAPHAIFRSRFGSIRLTLATKGSSERCHRTIVDVSTRHGDIAIDFASVHPGKHITLKVTSRRGKIIVLLPRTFCGDVQIRSGKVGGYDILPGLSSSIRSMKGRSGKASLRVGDSPPTSEANSLAMDNCRLSSRHGKIILGLSGEDSMPTQQRQNGIRAKIGAFFRGIGS
ncbi:hypothetical protein M405DRAFT_262663 [Rhizopogon salebrosus TDB-379]|nr:hypothetical protein M405DRAFT_262663 [Rhizopogon salebrosus TDB-379]